MRLQRFLSRAGAASRRGAEDLMTAGRVTVNGAVVTELGAKVDPAADTVAVDGRPVVLGEGPYHYVLDKPAGYLTTMSDPRGRPTVAELLPRLADGTVPPGLFPVGRLDKDTTGLLLLTSDGELGHRLAHPRFHVPKTYLAVVRGELREPDAERLRRGVMLEDGPTQPAEVRLLHSGPDRSEAEITIREGRKRQVRRMLDAVGHPVLGLRRTRFGPVEAGGLGPGQARPLMPEEVAALREAAGSGGEA
ncbi:MAG: rRNA pseudouridine synthase [Coriobacteriia bacterium]|nr:rRNA pseudouridine synthase [Coriobacteriia bacterium]